MSNEVLNESMMIDVLNICYDKVVNRLPKVEDILNKSSIGKEFRNKRLDNFDFSRSMAIANEPIDTGILIIYGLLLADSIVWGDCLILMRLWVVG